MIVLFSTIQPKASYVSTIMPDSWTEMDRIVYTFLLPSYYLKIWRALFALNRISCGIYSCNSASYVNIFLMESLKKTGF